MQQADRRYPWQPWKREPPSKWPITGNVTLKNSVEILTKTGTYTVPENTHENTIHPARGGGEGV